jgi:hypothetical protein
MLTKSVLLALAGAGVLGLTTINASARIVCNDDGDCRHVQTDYAYPPALGLTIHPDDWKWKEGERHAWREHEGRGYWKGDT